MDEKSGKKPREREPESKAPATVASKDEPSRDVGMQLTREVRIGLGVVAALLLVFGFVFVKKINDSDANRAAFVPPNADPADSQPSRANIAPTVVGGDESPRQASQPPEEPFASRYPPRHAEAHDAQPRAGSSFLPSRETVAAEMAKGDSAEPTPGNAKSRHDIPHRTEPEIHTERPSFAEAGHRPRRESPEPALSDENLPRPSRREYATDGANSREIARETSPRPLAGDPPPREKDVVENVMPARISAVPESPVVEPIQPSQPPSESPAPGAPHVRTRIYTVRANETVYDIARRELGGVARWKEIVALNRETLGDDIDALRAGMKIQIPAQHGGASVARSRDELPWR